MKTCLRCNEQKSLTLFHSRIHTSKYTGQKALHYTSYCKECNKAICKANRCSLSGLFTLIYSGQLGSSKLRNHAAPEYSKDELISWINDQPHFTGLYTAWVVSGYLSTLKPSIDRLDEAKPYSLQNIRLVTWRENEIAHKQKMVTVGDSTCKSVHQYFQGERINTFHSIHEASRQTGAAAGNILRCCRGEYETSKSFVWRYANE